MGVFAKKVHEIYQNHPLEEEGRLTNLFIREHFLTAVYTLASFRQLLKNPSAAGLVKFQTQNKFLLLDYNQKLMREMGRLVSGQKEAGLKTTMEKYQEFLRLVFRKQPRRVSNINTHMHALENFSDELTSDEKAYFLDTLEKFRNGIVPLSVLNSLTWSWIVRFKEDYLRHQTYFQPFPESLLDHLDSGKKQRVYQSV